MSFLIDPPWLYANGQAYARLAPEPERPGLARSVSIYLNPRWTRPLARACRAQDGRDWMLNYSRGPRVREAQG